MARWEFNEADPSDVDIEMTQRDQFNNDDVDLPQALVREVIQNSSDAAVSDMAVKVRFSFIHIDGPELEDFQSHYELLFPHLKACNVDTSAVGGGPCRMLVIEDFNTRGLTGKTDELDDDNFRNFWRRHGKSSKKGRQGGRWGLGKLVYSSSSPIRVFYGLTVRHGEDVPLLMGQAVLTNHEVEGRRYHAHGFWFSERAENRLQLPIIDRAEIDRFRALTGLQRDDQPGLSIVIPYVFEGIDDQAIIEGVLTNYYFPILSGKLEVEVGGQLIDKNTFFEIAEQTGAGQKTGVPFNFIKEISEKAETKPDCIAARAIGVRPLDREFFKPEEREQMKAAFAKGELVHVRVPVRLARKSGEEVVTAVDLFLRSLPEGSRSFALYARGPITLPGERRYFQGSTAYGAFVASEEAVAEFLGDAESPAHTTWNSNAEKLAEKWANRQNTLRAIRYALHELYVLVAEQIDIEDKNALIDFFSLADQGASVRGRKRRSRKPKPEIEPREKAIRIRGLPGGFEIASGPGAAEWEFPRRIRVRLAYDMIGGNPFKHHSPFDFDLTKDSIGIACASATIKPLRPNVLIMEVHSEDFRLEADGFDRNRDLVVDARAL